MKDELWDRMKTYESVTRTFIPRRSYTIIRCDGKAFHTYTRGLERPFDAGLTEDMNQTAIALCKGIQGAVMAYVQSDEISVLICDFDTNETQAWYGNNSQKMCSISASIATDAFNRARFIRACDTDEGTFREPLITQERLENMRTALFDSRVFQIPQRSEVVNYFVWRQKDAVRNSISSTAQSLYSHRELNGKSTNEMQGYGTIVHQQLRLANQNVSDALQRCGATNRGIGRGYCRLSTHQD
jgi:tRNA(His) 5'-end guanylyltransferase